MCLFQLRRAPLDCFFSPLPLADVFDEAFIIECFSVLSADQLAGEGNPNSCSILAFELAFVPPHCSMIPELFYKIQTLMLLCPHIKSRVDVCR